MVNKMVYNGLIFEGGGVKGMTYVGAMEAFIQKYNISDINYVGGTSAGAIMATLLASEHTLAEINDILFSIQWSKLKDGDFDIFRNTYRLINKFGYHRGNYMEKLMNKILYKKFNIYKITFKEMYEITNIHLRMVGTNITKGVFEYFDHIHTPHMSIAKAVRISSCVPFFFKPVELYGNYYIDGGLVRNIDVNMFDDCDNMNILVFDLQDKVDIQKDKSENIMVYVSRILDMIYKEANAITKKENKQIDICPIIETKISFINFDISDQDKTYLKNQGYNNARYFFHN